MKIIIAVIVLLISSTFLFTESFAQGVPLTNDFGTIVYQFNGLYYVKDPLTGILASSDTPDNIIKTALGRGGEIYIEGGTYHLSKDFAGFDLKYGTHLKLAQDAYVIVPSGYGGYVFRLGVGAAQCVLEGGSIYEASPIKRSWVGIMMQGSKNGVYFNLIQNMVITYPDIVIDFNATTGQWINANTFVNIKGEDFVKGIEFDFNGKHTLDVDGFQGNTFRDSQFQSGPMTTYGVKDIKHKFIAFYNVQIWDLPPRAISSTIDPSAVDTMIIGGQMTYQGFEDKGVNSIVLDSLHNSLSSNSTITSELIKGTHQPKANIPVIPSNQGLNMSMPKQLTTGLVKGNKAQIAISQEIPIDINVYGKVSNPRGGSVILYITGPDGVIEQNQAYVTSDGTFYYPLIFDRSSLIGQYKINALYHDSNLGSLFINVTSDQTLPTDTSSNQSPMIVPPSNSNETLSVRINNDARLWSQGKISDDTFGNTIQYLINTGIIQKANENRTSLDQTVHIPTWFKNNAGWLVDGQISYSDFISEIQYLLKNGMILMPSQ
jgi:hypothetical protein